MGCLEDAEIKALRPDALAPAEIALKAETIAVGKVALQPTKAFVLAILAGAFIAFGAAFFCVFLGDSTIPFAVQRLIGGVCFTLGLVLVLCCGAELFTGNSLMVAGAMSKKISWTAMLKNWIIVWIGNLAGALVAVFLIFMAHVADMNGGGVGSVMISVAVSKVTPDMMTLFFKAILCNLLVCLAVWIGYSARTIADKVLGILLPIAAFVACGFEHCVANMFFLPMGMVLKESGYSSTVNMDALDISAILCNISVVTLGNIVGGILIGLAYWFVYRSQKA